VAASPSGDVEPWFEHAPTALLVVSREGVVCAANLRAREAWPGPLVGRAEAEVREALGDGHRVEEAPLPDGSRCLAVREAADGESFQQIAARLVLASSGGPGEHPAWHGLVATLARALGVDRVGLWLMRGDRSALSCLVRVANGEPAPAGELDSQEVAGMLEALRSDPVIAAPEASSDPRLACLRPTLDRLGAGAVLAAPIHVGGGFVGLLMAEHPGGPRAWTQAETGLLTQVAELTGLALEARDRRRAAELLERAEARYELLAACASEVVWRLDSQLRVTYVSPAVRAQRGFEPQVAATLSVEEALSEAAAALGRAALLPDGDPDEGLLGRLREGLTLEAELERKDGSRFFAEIVLSLSAPEGGERGLVAITRDIHQSHLADLRAASSEASSRLLARLATDGLWEWDPSRDHLTTSPRFRQLLGVPEEARMGTLGTWLEVVHADDRGRLDARLDRMKRGELAALEEEVRMIHRDGTIRWIVVRGLPGTGRETGTLAGVISDVTARRRFEEQLRHDAFHDALTKLPNRSLFKDHLERTTRRRVRQPDLVYAVLLLDLDEFKVVNDGLGHHQGDELLVQIARRLEYGLRPADTVARFGGDEFAILLDEITATADATRVAERLLADLARPFVMGGEEVYISASVGIAIAGSHYERPDDILRDADTAMYRAKLRGRGHYEVFDPKMHRRALERIQLEADLRRALERGEFRIFYQPVVSLQDDRVVGFEALIRWEHPERGLLGPGHFLDVAEAAGIIVPIGWRMLEEACRQAREWCDMFPRRQPPLFVSVNLSNRQFAQPDLVQQVERALLAAGLAAACIRLEITEGVVAENAEAAKETLLKLRSLGIRLDMDDFGTGYSSLSQLHYFPVDTLKIDRSFVNRMGAQGQQTEMVWTIIALAQHLGMSVTAEGIETAEQVQTLKQLACHHGQGYFFSEPVTTEAATRLLSTHPPAWAARTVPA
jgi:diguanylate cyclase (GGDEF)-like protein/PAS domain S-box-containing protein